MIGLFIVVLVGFGLRGAGSFDCLQRAEDRSLNLGTDQVDQHLVSLLDTRGRFDRNDELDICDAC